MPDSASFKLGTCSVVLASLPGRGGTTAGRARLDQFMKSRLTIFTIPKSSGSCTTRRTTSGHVEAKWRSRLCVANSIPPFRTRGRASAALRRARAGWPAALERHTHLLRVIPHLRALLCRTTPRTTSRTRTTGTASRRSAWASRSRAASRRSRGYAAHRIPTSEQWERP
jgi:hypothetical protein